MWANSEKLGELAHGPYDSVVRRNWTDALTAADEINRRNLDYKMDDPSYEIVGGDGGQIQNSNSVAYTVSKAGGMDADEVLQDSGKGRLFPGWGRDLLDPDYKPYVAPPVFPNANTP
ncbi:MAG TPA: hypothetical protein VFB13_02080 [Reyranella sp.]|jgi:hypothetical protein|nr:hypothetical protein [Reyranella sp.]